MKKLLILMLFVLSTGAIASDSWPGWFKSHHDTNYSRQGTTRGGGTPEGATYAVVEPGTLALLGAGLVSLGIYAKRKQRKKS